MAITRLAHYSIRTTDLEASRRFYTEVLGFRVGYRPEFPFPGIWLYNGPDDGDFGIVHIIGFDANDASGLVGYLGMGILSRLMPTMQVFFVIIPPQILISFAVLMTCLSGMLLWYLEFAEEHLNAYVGQ